MWGESSDHVLGGDLIIVLVQSQMVSAIKMQNNQCVYNEAQKRFLDMHIGRFCLES